MGSKRALGGAVDVVVIVVTWNSEQVIPGFLATLPEAFTGSPYELVVADNASTDATIDVVRELAPTARIVHVGRNGGYAAGVNAGLATGAGARAVLICNPDVRLGRGAVRLLLSALDDPSVGIAVPRMVDPDGNLLPSLRRTPTIMRALGEAVLGGARAGRFEHLGEVVHRRDAYDVPSDVDWATGAALLVSRQCLRLVGGWDETFFLYSEETDFALRARDAGFRIRYIPDAVVEHEGGGLHDSPELWSLHAVNRVRLFERRHGRVATWAFWTAATLNEGLRALAGRPTSRVAFRALRQWRRAQAAT